MILTQIEAQLEKRQKGKKLILCTLSLSHPVTPEMYFGTQITSAVHVYTLHASKTNSLIMNTCNCDWVSTQMLLKMLISMSCRAV